jgi:uncharacterized membrane protein
MAKLDTNVLHHPVVVAQFNKRAADVQLRIADRITAFAGSMAFVYLHAAIFVTWMLVFEKSPWPTLTLIVSLEAIFLSTFVMIGQNRQASFQQAKADHDYGDIDKLLIENTDLTQLIHQLTEELHRHVLATSGPPADHRGPSRAPRRRRQSSARSLWLTSANTGSAWRMRVKSVRARGTSPARS